MPTHELEAVGLSRSAIDVYETLIDQGTASLADLIVVTPLNSEDLGRTLAELEAVGLARRLSGQDAVYSPAPPEVGIELLLRHRDEELARARQAAEELSARFRQARVGRSPDKLIEVIVGQQEVNEQYTAVFRIAQSELRIMSRPPYHQTPEENRDLAGELHQQQIRGRSIIDPEYFDTVSNELDAVRADIAAGEEYRVVSHVPMKLTIADDERAIIPLESPPHGIQSALLVHPSALLRALSDVFETLWHYALPLDVLRTQGELRDPSGSPGEDERKLVSLLAAGVPDSVIERQLGISHRTVLRRVQDLKEKLGAASRFQAGVLAALRGWITDPGAPNGGKPSP